MHLRVVQVEPVCAGYREMNELAPVRASCSVWWTMYLHPSNQNRIPVCDVLLCISFRFTSHSG